jgi:hypothetical protein
MGAGLVDLPLASVVTDCRGFVSYDDFGMGKTHTKVSTFR